MEHKIKFRAWDKENGMTTCFSIHANGNIAYLGDNWLRESEKPILMQYTGFEDDFETEIYVGDIVEFSSLQGDIKRYVVKFKYGSFYLEERDDLNGFLTKASVSFYDLQFSSQFKLKVIGNIYENNELLKDLKVIGNIYENPELINY